MGNVYIDINSDGSYKRSEGYKVRYHHPLAEKMAKHIFVEWQQTRGNMRYYQKHPNRWIGLAILMYPSLLEHCCEILYEVAYKIDNGDQGTDRLKEFLEAVSNLKEN